MYEFIKEIHQIGNRIVDETRKLSLGHQTPQRVYSFCLHGRIVDLASAVLALLETHDVAGIPHLVRGQLEAFADLVSLAKSAGHLKNMGRFRLSCGWIRRGGRPAVGCQALAGDR